jgi:tetratricopeptide (TPR) repeat protein
MSLSGNLKTMELSELLQWVTLGRKTGSLTFIREKTKNYIYFRDGQIISSRSNDPTKLIGHFLLFYGKITEDQLKRTLEIQQQTRATLGKILVQEGFLSKEEVEKALISRTEEVIYDLFLWEDAYFHFSTDGYEIEDLMLINLNLNSLLFEGVRRKDEWKRIRESFPSNEVVLSLRKGADLKNLPLTQLQKKLLFLVSQGKTVSQMILEVHGSDFLVNYELYRLYDSNVLEIKELPAPPPTKEDPAKLFSRGLELMQSRKHTQALTVFQEVLRLDPENIRADKAIEEVERAICDDFYRDVMPANLVPYFVIPESTLPRYNLTHEEGFVASRINGTWDLKSIVMLSPLREIEVLRIVDRLLKMGLIALR